MFNGAPWREHLDFSDSSLIPAESCNAFDVATGCRTQGEESTPRLKWRSLAKNTRLLNEWQQSYLPGSILGSDMADFSLPNVDRFQSFVQEEATGIDTTIDFNDPTYTTDGFLEHSLVFHDTLLSSQMIPDEGPDTTISSSSFLTTSFGTTTSELSSPSKANQHYVDLVVPAKLSVTPLASLPSAQHLRAIYPQTPTPNFVCVITTNPEEREVFVRKGGYKMNLWEVTVADDTFSGFKVTFWLRPAQESNSERALAQASLLRILQSSRIGDIVLLRNIALTTFRDTVFGQSLNPAITRARTNIHVLMKSNGISPVQSGGIPISVTEAFMRVKKWARVHVASESVGLRKRKGSIMKQDDHAKRAPANCHLDDSMPPDTMESI